MLRSSSLTLQSWAQKAMHQASVDVVIEEILSIVSRLFVVSNSKNVLQAVGPPNAAFVTCSRATVLWYTLCICQVGLSALVHVLPDYPNLLPVFAGAPVVGFLGWQGVARQPDTGSPAACKCRKQYIYLYVCMYVCIDRIDSTTLSFLEC